MKNNQMHAWVFVCLLFCFLVWNISTFATQEAPPEEAMKVAKAFLEILKPKFKSGEFPMYIKADEGIDNFTIGPSYKYYLIDSQKLLNISNEELFESCMKFHAWSFLVMSDEDIRVVINVKKKESAWEISGFGKPLDNLQELNNIWPVSRGYSFSVAKLPGQCVLAFTKIDKQELFYPLTIGAANIFNLKKDNEGLYPVLKRNEVMNGLIKLLNM